MCTFLHIGSILCVRLLSNNHAHAYVTATAQQWLCVSPFLSHCYCCQAESEGGTGEESRGRETGATTVGKSVWPW